MLGLFTLACVLSCCTSLRILSVLPFPMKSHHIVVNALLEGLVSRGHDVTVYSGYPLNIKASNYKHIHIKTSFDVIFANYSYERIKSSVEGKEDSVLAALPFQNLHAITEESLSLPSIKELIESSEKFDAIILEAFFSQEALLGFGYKFNVPVVVFSSFGSNSAIDSAMGNPNPVSYIPNMSFKYNCDLTFYQRLRNMLKTFTEEIFLYFVHNPRQEDIMRKHFGGTVETLPSLQSLINNVSLILLSSQPELNYARPFLPNMVQVGGMHIKPARKSLPKEVQRFMDTADAGVVYLSLGSTLMGSSVPAFFNEAFVQAFSVIADRVLWKIDSPPAGLPENVMTVKWASQIDILAHPKCKAFITHGGLLSLFEATYYGVPLVGIPFFGDQTMNIAKVKHEGIGVGLDFFNISSDSITWALNEIINNPRYKKKIDRLSAQMRDRLVSPLDTAVYWVEYVAKHQGAPQLQSPARNMSYFQYLLFDVLSILLIMIFIFTIFIYFTVVHIYNFIMQKKCNVIQLNKKNQ